MKAAQFFREDTVKAVEFSQWSARLARSGDIEAAGLSYRYALEAVDDAERWRRMMLSDEYDRGYSDGLKRWRRDGPRMIAGGTMGNTKEDKR